MSNKVRYHGLFPYHIPTIRNGSAVVNHSVYLGCDGKCKVKGLEFPSLESAITYYQSHPLDGVKLVGEVSPEAEF